MRKRSKQVSPLEDPTYSGAQYEQDKESIARGNSPYTPELNIGVPDYRGEDMHVQRGMKRNYMSREEASRMVNDFDWSERYLRSIIAKYVSPDLADRLDYSGLRREARKVRGIAKKILGNEKLGDIGQLTEFTRKLLRGD